MLFGTSPQAAPLVAACFLLVFWSFSLVGEIRTLLRVPQRARLLLQMEEVVGETARR